MVVNPHSQENFASNLKINKRKFWRHIGFLFTIHLWHNKTFWWYWLGFRYFFFHFSATSYRTEAEIAKRNMLEYNITILKWYDFHKAWIWLRFFKALKFGTGRWWRRNSIEFLVSQKENNVSWSHTNKRGHKSLVKCQKAFIRNGGQPTFPRRFCKQLENKSHNKQV